MQILASCSEPGLVLLAVYSLILCLYPAFSSGSYIQWLPQLALPTELLKISLACFLPPNHPRTPEAGALLAGDLQQAQLLCLGITPTGLQLAVVPG